VTFHGPRPQRARPPSSLLRDQGRWGGALEEGRTPVPGELGVARRWGLGGFPPSSSLCSSLYFLLSPRVFLTWGRLLPRNATG
jgi:hypothetical protein